MKAEQFCKEAAASGAVDFFDRPWIDSLKGTVVTIDYRSGADDRMGCPRAASRVYATLAILVVLTFFAGSSAMCYSVGYSIGYGASERQNAATAQNRHAVVARYP
jgi:hypothetical protein